MAINDVTKAVMHERNDGRQQMAMLSSAIAADSSKRNKRAASLGLSPHSHTHSPQAFANTGP
eukprot:2764342-Pleurochrysis_carterae.AAC.2